jgi:hypothetical protein
MEQERKFIVDSDAGSREFATETEARIYAQETASYSSNVKIYKCDLFADLDNEKLLYCIDNLSTLEGLAVERFVQIMESRDEKRKLIYIIEEAADLWQSKGIGVYRFPEPKIIVFDFCNVILPFYFGSEKVKDAFGECFKKELMKLAHLQEAEKEAKVVEYKQENK